VIGCGPNAGWEDARSTHLSVSETDPRCERSPHREPHQTLFTRFARRRAMALGRESRICRDTLARRWWGQLSQPDWLIDRQTLGWNGARGGDGKASCGAYSR